MGMKFGKLFTLAFVFLFALDFSWAAFIAHDFYAGQLGALISTHPIVAPLVAFYVIYAIAIAHFVLKPAFAHGSSKHMLKDAALLGLTAYGTYDLINYGLTPGWPAAVTFVDIAWGIVVTMLVSWLAYNVAKKWKK
jgi:uncharacterized membrane protein